MKSLTLLEGAERYEIIHLIAEGGMGAVYKAKKIGVAGFEKIVAIKVMLDTLAANESRVAEFISEAKLVANLIHENIVQIYQLQRGAQGYYFVIEYVDGIALSDFIDFHRTLGRRIPLPLAVFIAARVARGLAYAHSRRDAGGRPLGIVHCDVCTHNVLINTEGVPKITDFGIARVAADRREGARISGKLAFMSPEQAALEAVDFRSDIYSLGMVLFLMLTGKPARDLKASASDLLAQARGNQIAWEQLPEDLPPELSLILRRMLAADPADRYGDTAELARDLEYFIYKDGYGPTIVTLADYMRELMPGRFAGAEQSVIADDDRTIVMTTKTITGNQMQ